jgi:hypothetical protein
LGKVRAQSLVVLRLVCAAKDEGALGDLGQKWAEHLWETFIERLPPW